jgi:hypothetical protein
MQTGNSTEKCCLVTGSIYLGCHMGQIFLSAFPGGFSPGGIDLFGSFGSIS